MRVREILSIPNDNIIIPISLGNPTQVQQSPILHSETPPMTSPARRTLLFLSPTILLVAAILIALLLPRWNTFVRDSWVRSAEASIRQNDFTAALDAVNHALASDPDNPSLLQLRGRVFMYRYEWDHALADYDRALQLAPTDPALLYDRAVLFYTRLELDRALAGFQQVIALAPAAPLSAQAAAYIAAIRSQQSALDAP